MDYTNIIADIFDINEANINDELLFNSIEGWDSMSHMMFITKLEEEYNITLDGSEIAGMKTVKDLKLILEKHNAAE